MDWMRALSFKKKLLIGSYSVIALFALFSLLFLFADLPPVVGILILVVLLIVAYPIINALSKLLTEPIESVTLAAMAIAKGDFTQQIQVHTNDELGSLAQSFNRMVEKLRDILNETSNISRHVSDSSRDIYVKNQNLKEVLGQVASSATELASGATQISEEVGDISQSIKDIESKVVNYAHSTKEMNARSEQAVELVETGRKAVDSQAEGMKRNVEATSIVSQTIEELAKQANGINKITQTISELAEQTNLLSLNASIEAARAGEHGRGFAVVAQEVRTLAEESSAATKEVFNLVRSINNGIQQAIQNIHTNETIVTEQNRLIQETERVFAEIVHSVSFFSEQISSFARESDQMLENARRISSTIESISAITQQSAAGTEQVSASMNEQISAVQEMVERSEQMAQVVSQLQRTIQIFKFTKN